MKVQVQVVFWLAAAILASLLILLLKDILLPFVAGMVIAYALNPLVGHLSRLGIPRILASLIIVAMVLLVLIAALVIVVPLLLAQAQQFAAALPGELDKLQAMSEAWARERLGDRFDGLRQAIEDGLKDMTGTFAGFATSFAQSLWTRGMAIVNFLALLLVTPVVVFYLLSDWPAIVGQLDRWMPRDHAPTIRRVAGEIDAAIAAFIRGQGLVCLILAMVYAVGLSLAGLKYGVLIGVLTGLLSFVPFVGWALGLITASTFAVLEYWPSAMPLVKVLAVFALGQALDAGFLAPRIVGSKIGLHPVWLIFALFVFSYLFGFVGTLVAVPLAAATAVLVRFALEVYIKSTIYTGSQPDPSVADSVVNEAGRDNG
ncbi:MAG: hypothetical protein RLZ98_3824 [Pseudomonadota bacterium]|jgi:predicted PurR-regulated permease PerM